MKYLNVGCGGHFSTNAEWTNLDFVSTGSGVIAHNLLQGIPFEKDRFDFVYHSHVLEHFSREDGEKLIQECNRVLKQNGVLRIVIPDLERIAREYLKYLELGMENQNDLEIEANYEWMKIEMYDQAVRNVSGGQMVDVLSKSKLINEDFIYSRIGEEGKAIRKSLLNNSTSNKSMNQGLSFLQKIKRNIKKMMKVDNYNHFYQIGHFRLQGEIHQWMYDQYSLKKLLDKNGFKDFKIQTAFDSMLSNWNEYNIDGKNAVPRKPDSLYVEAVKI